MASVLFLLLVGLAMLLPTESASLRNDSFATRASHFFWRQVVLTVVGLAMLLWAACTDYRIWGRRALPLLLMTVLLLVLVLIPPIGTRHAGAYRMFDVGLVQVRPAVPARIVVILYLAYWLARRRPGVQDSSLKGSLAAKADSLVRNEIKLLPILPVIVVMGLIWLEPDPVTNNLIGLVVVVLLLLGGVRWRTMARLCAVAVGVILWRMWSNPFAWARLSTYWRRDSLHDGISRSPSIGEMILSQSGWTGTGLGQGHLTQNLSPSASSDYIGAFIVEAFGRAGLLCVSLAFAAFVVAGFSVSARARDRFGLLLGAGIVTLIGVQALLHLTVVSGLLPARPVSLPFVSYGGGELCVLLTGVGVLLSIARHAPPEGSGSP